LQEAAKEEKDLSMFIISIAKIRRKIISVCPYCRAVIIRMVCEIESPYFK